MDTSELKPKNQTSSSAENYALNGMIMLCSVIILFGGILIMFCVHSYIQWLFMGRCRRRASQQPLSLSANTTTITNNNNNDNVAVVPNQSKALDLSTLKAIPTFSYDPTTHVPMLECAVCISDFEQEERGRVLPTCRHAFHVECIDMWFHSHSNCPLCRSPVQVQNNNKNKALLLEIMDGTVVSVIESTGSEHELCRKEEDKDYHDMGSSSSPPPRSSSSSVERTPRRHRR